jgi:hypothetical protein
MKHIHYFDYCARARALQYALPGYIINALVVVTSLYNTVSYTYNCLVQYTHHFHYQAKNIYIMKDCLV